MLLLRFERASDAAQAPAGRPGGNTRARLMMVALCVVIVAASNWESGRAQLFEP